MQCNVMHAMIDMCTEIIHRMLLKEILSFLALVTWWMLMYP